MTIWKNNGQKWKEIEQSNTNSYLQDWGGEGNKIGGPGKGNESYLQYRARVFPSCSRLFPKVQFQTLLSQECIWNLTYSES